MRRAKHHGLEQLEAKTSKGWRMWRNVIDVGSHKQGAARTATTWGGTRPWQACDTGAKQGGIGAQGNVFCGLVCLACGFVGRPWKTEDKINPIKRMLCAGHGSVGFPCPPLPTPHSQNPRHLAGYNTYKLDFLKNYLCPLLNKSKYVNGLGMHANIWCQPSTIANGCHKKEGYVDSIIKS